MFVNMCFKIISKVVKYTCRLRRYNYTHDQLNTKHYIITFLGIFLRGGAQNSSLPPGARYPRYATGCIAYSLRMIATGLQSQESVEPFGVYFDKICLTCTYLQRTFIFYM